MNTQLATVVPQYMRLAAGASAETIRRNPLTARYFSTYFQLARTHGTPNARAWLLGSIIRDLHGATTSGGARPTD